MGSAINLSTIKATGAGKETGFGELLPGRIGQPWRLEQALCKAASYVSVRGKQVKRGRFLAEKESNWTINTYAAPFLLVLHSRESSFLQLL